MNKGVKVRATNIVDNTQLFFDSVKEAAVHANVTPPSMSHRIRACMVDSRGFLYEYVSEDFSQLSERQLRYRKDKLNDFRYSDDDVNLSDGRYKILSYEVKSKRVCITPCPYKGYPKPFVGSLKCLKCSSFRGRNKKTHQVACNHS